ncbi:MAG: acetyl-CoA carboxylase biotin carboxyl carrier protein [Verrucomicrobiota bacterium]|jgi:acetyl-CoA carboxylase biotin carboxyl carrier protein|nr:acetyl-CoA carboxylase biotin carboxyl carrier protein [Verrucomicrobiota bacterium]MED5258774.1 acetyl-CoA carboxylase biotin carboxyl carrier protein [Verrucomicrobiota bacterium]MED5456922.1 acetyl-CoA carboxylase biotin carboxyl carrier protein [Verrucomicrobiota bacterium]MEE2724725.1 acetyl-CoA carboxylase biotin carboxyl carrier protein [Verrucomicrobiota bacterium]|tara:strand:- start:13 stop:489 length:477 start_codon:yes stop_codon:yes gene_type:complete
MPVTRRNRKSEEESSPSPEIDLTKIKDLIKLMEDHDLTAFELEDSGFKVRLEKGGTPEQVIAAAPPVAVEEKAPEKIVAEETEEISAPMVGTFYKSPSPDADAFVKVGDSVDEGTVVCIIEAMKVMNQIKAEKSGVIQRILVEDASPVEFGQGLFVIA